MDDSSLSPLLTSMASAKVAARRYLLSRQGRQGGFCFYRSEYIDHPNLHDTYHAVAALTLLQAALPQADAVVDFLKGFHVAEPTAVYYAACTLDYMGRADSIDLRWLACIRGWDVRATLPASGRVTTGWLQSSLRLVRLKRRFANLSDAVALADFIASLQSGGGFGMTPNLLDTWLCLGILDLLSIEVQKEAVRDFVDKLQVPSFGFTAASDCMLTSLDVIRAGIGCCKLLGAPIRHGADALSYVLACQSTDGGFSRTSKALPDLEQTHRALQIIGLLEPILRLR